VKPHPFGPVIDMPYAYDPDPPRLRPKVPTWEWTCPTCGWHTRNIEYEQHVCPGGPVQPEGRIEDE
jgi:hypothetical protein